MTQNGFSSVLVITSTQKARGLTGQPSVAFGKPLELTVTLRSGAPTMSLGQRRPLFSMKDVFLLVSRPTGSFMSIMLSPLMIARFGLFCFVTTSFNFQVLSNTVLEIIFATEFLFH